MRTFSRLMISSWQQRRNWLEIFPHVHVQEYLLIIILLVLTTLHMSQGMRNFRQGVSSTLDDQIGRRTLCGVSHRQ